MKYTTYTISLSSKYFHGHLTADGYYSSNYEFSDRADAMDFNDLASATEVADDAYNYINEHELYEGLKSIYVGETSSDAEGEPVFNIVYELFF